MFHLIYLAYTAIAAVVTVVSGAVVSEVVSDGVHGNGIHAVDENPAGDSIFAAIDTVVDAWNDSPLGIAVNFYSAILFHSGQNADGGQAEVLSRDRYVPGQFRDVLIDDIPEAELPGIGASYTVKLPGATPQITRTGGGGNVVKFPGVSSELNSSPSYASADQTRHRAISSDEYETVTVTPIVPNSEDDVQRVMDIWDAFDLVDSLEFEFDLIYVTGYGVNASNVPADEHVVKHWASHIFEISSMVPTATGDTFLYWSPEPYISDDLPKYRAGDTITLSWPFNCTQYLYAVWQENPLPDDPLPGSGDDPLTSDDRLPLGAVHVNGYCQELPDWGALFILIIGVSSLIAFAYNRFFARPV